MFFKRRENRLTRNSASLASLIMENDIRPREGDYELLHFRLIFDEMAAFYSQYCVYHMIVSVRSEGQTV